MPVDAFDTFFLALVLALGGIMACYDLRIGKVRNRHIAIGLLAGMAGYLFLGIQARLFYDPELVYLKRVLINICFSWTASFLLWYFDMWSAGDAKFFMFLSFLLPLKYYGQGYITSYFPSSILFLNAFIFVLVFILLEISFRIIAESVHFILNFKKNRKDFGKILYVFISKIKDDKMKYLKLIWGYLCIFLSVRLLVVYLRNKLFGIAPIFENFSYILMILLFRPLNMFFRKAASKLFWLPTSILLIYSLYCISSLSKGEDLGIGRIFGRFFGFMGVLFAVRLIIALYIKKKEVIKIEPGELEPKMVLTEESAKKINDFLKEANMKEKFYCDGLTSRQVGLIKKLSLKSVDLSEVSVYKTFPLAPFIFLGVIVTILVKGPVIDFPFLVSVVKAVK